MIEGETKRSIQSTRYLAAIILLVVAFGSSVIAQDSVLEKAVTVNMTRVQKQMVFRSLTRQSGYVFTYDTELIKPDEITSVNFQGATIRTVLDSIFAGENFGYSVIDNHIIIYKKVDESTPMIREEGEPSVFLISGTIVESATLKPLPYATIGIYNIGLGTISNEEGNFELKVTENTLNDSLKISYLGFVDRTIPVSQAIENHYIIQLERDYVPIPEIIIRSREPLDLIDNIRKNIENNYGSSPAILKAFYRESVSKRNKVQLYSEAVIDIYKSSYTRPLRTDQISIHKSRKIENVDKSDTLLIKLQAGLDACLELDGIKKTFDFINPLNFTDYRYRMTDIVNIGNEAAYVIEFTQKDNTSDNALFQGSIYINTDNYGVHSFEFEINPDHIDLLSENYIRESSRGFTVKLRQVKYKVDYRYIDNRYFLNHVRGDMEFYARKRKKVFGSNYNIIFEMAVTGIDTINVERFSRDRIVPKQSVFWETINGYDTEFWGTDNYVKPELDIQEALKQINARLGEYKKED